MNGRTNTERCSCRVPPLILKCEFFSGGSCICATAGLSSSVELHWSVLAKWDVTQIEVHNGPSSLHRAPHVRRLGLKRNGATAGQASSGAVGPLLLLPYQRKKTPCKPEPAWRLGLKRGV